MEISVPSKSIQPPPPLPPKLPPEQRKKLSIVFEDSNNRESKRREEETDKLQDIPNNLPVVFLNDSSSTLISSQNEEETEVPLENGYLSLEFLQSMLIDSDSHKSDFNSNADTSCPPIPPKRTKSLKKASFRSSSGKSIGFEARSFALGSFHIYYYIYENKLFIAYVIFMLIIYFSEI